LPLEEKNKNKTNDKVNHSLVLSKETYDPTTRTCSKNEALSAFSVILKANGTDEGKQLPLADKEMINEHAITDERMKSIICARMNMQR